MAKRRKGNKVIPVKPSAGDIGEIVNKWDVLGVIVPGLKSLLNIKRGVLVYELKDMEKSIDDLFAEGNIFKGQLMADNPDATAIMLKVEHWKDIVEDLVDDVILELNKCLKDDEEDKDAK